MSGFTFPARDEDAIRRLKEDPEAYFAEHRLSPFPSVDELDVPPVVENWESWFIGFVCGAFFFGMVVPLLVLLVFG